MYEQILEDAIFVMLYAVVTVLAALGCVYLLFRRGNACGEPAEGKICRLSDRCGEICTNGRGHHFTLQ